MGQILYKFSSLIIGIALYVTIIIQILQIKKMKPRVKVLFKDTIYKQQSQNLNPRLSDSIARPF